MAVSWAAIKSLNCDPPKPVLMVRKSGKSNAKLFHNLMELLPVKSRRGGGSTLSEERPAGAAGGDWHAVASRKSERRAMAFISTKKAYFHKGRQTNSLYSMNTAMSNTNQAKAVFNLLPSMRLLRATPINMPAPESRMSSARKG